MNPELEKFIDFAVADGEVTEKEKAILIRKAEELSVDLDEMEMVLDAKLHLAKKEAQPKETPKQETPAPAPSQESSSITKCPQCAAAIESFSTRCPYCDAELKDIKASSSISKLNEILLNVEKEMKKELDERHYENEVDRTLARQKLEWSGYIERKISIINSFPVPNSQEDILEFLFLAKSIVSSSKAGWFARKLGGPTQKLNQAWIGKCEQVIMKARISMKNDKKTLEEIESYAKQLEIK